MSSEVIELNDLEVGIGDCHIVRGVNLELSKGQSLVVMGPNGSGKSTLLKAMTGIQNDTLSLSYSRFICDGFEYSELDYSKRSRLWTIVPQFPEWQQGLKVAQYLEYSRFPLFKEGKGSDGELLAEICEGLGLKGLLDKNLEVLSGGERKRVAIAAALYQDVGLVYLDEPFQALDPLAKIELANFLKNWQKKKDLTYVIASHDFYWSYQLCDQILFLKKGDPLFYGNKKENFTAENLEKVYDVSFEWVKLGNEDGFFCPLKAKGGI